MASNTTATTGCDCLVGGAAAPRYRPPGPLPLLRDDHHLRRARGGCSRCSAADSTSQQHPRRPSVAAPLRMELKGGAAVAATAAATAADSDGDGPSARGVAQLPLESADVGSRFLQVARCGCACVTRARGTRTSDVLTMSMA